MTLQELTVLAGLVLPRGLQRTDTNAADNEVNFYKSGSTIVMQVFDAEAGAWRSATLS
jgi:hypothetical protein